MREQELQKKREEYQGKSYIHPDASGLQGCVQCVCVCGESHDGTRTRGAHWTGEPQSWVGYREAKVAVFVQSERRGAGTPAGSEAACSSDSQAAGVRRNMWPPN